MIKYFRTRRFLSLLCIIGLLSYHTIAAQERPIKASLIHVSFDISRELVSGLSAAFIDEYQSHNPGSSIKIESSHAGSSKQVQALINGFPAELVSMNQFMDLQNIYERTKNRGPIIPAQWASLLPNSASFCYSTIVFVVRKANPKGIKDWDDLAKPGISIVSSNWKSSGSGRSPYLSLWAWAQNFKNMDKPMTIELARAIYKNIPAFANGGRDATTLFYQREQGDVLLAFEAEALQLLKHKPNSFQLIYPNYALMFPIYGATIESVAQKKATKPIADAFWQFCFSEAGQEIVAQNFFRPHNRKIALRYKSTLPTIPLSNLESAFTNWQTVNQVHFSSGGIVDQIIKNHL